MTIIINISQKLSFNHFLFLFCTYIQLSPIYICMQGKSKKFKKRQQREDIPISEATTKKNYESNPSSGKKKENSNFEVANFDDMTFEPSTKLKEYTFKHTFNQYVRMTLIKLLPLKSKDMTIDRQDELLKGPPQLCQKLKSRIKQELDQFTMKMIRFHSDQDIDTIEFHLKPQYEVKVYRIKFVQLAAMKVAEEFNFRQQAQNLISKMTRERQILVRILREFTQVCLQDINLIISKSKDSGGKMSVLNMSMISSSGKNNTLDDSGLTKTLYLDKNKSSSTDSLKQEDCQPSYYQITGEGVHNVESAVNSSPVKVEQRKRQNRTFSGNLVGVGKLQEPTEDDSVSVVGNRKNKKKKKNYQQKKIQTEPAYEPTPQKYQPPPKAPKKTKQLKRYQIEEDDFDQDDFNQWFKNRRHLQEGQVIIEKRHDPYDDGIISYVIKLVVTDDHSYTAEGQKIESLEFYFLFKKVIFIKLKNDGYKNQLVKDFVRKDDALTIEYVKGYKSPKWRENTMWSHIIKHNYSDEKKSANTEYFQAFYLYGLKNLVMQNYDKIKQKIDHEPKQDVLEDIMFTHDTIADYLRDNNQVKALMKKHTENVISETFKMICTLKEITFIVTAIKITVWVKFNHQNTFHSNTKKQIMKKLNDELKISSYDTNFVVDKFTYEKLGKNITIIQQSDRSFKFISSSIDLSSCFTKINSILNSVNTIQQNEIKIDDVLQGKQINDYVNELKVQREFQEIKVNSDIKKGAYVFKFYGRGYVLDSIQEKIKAFRQDILHKRLTYVQIVKPKEKQILLNQEFIDSVHEKHNILLQPHDSLLACRIFVVKEDDQNFKKKTIIIKKTKTLDYTPYGSVIVFRHGNEMDDFECNWIKTYKNFLKRHNSSTPFIQKSRNYTIFLKANLSTKVMLKDTLDDKRHFTTIVLVLQPNDKHIFIKEIVTLLIENKQYSDRQLTIILLETDQSVNMKKILQIEQYKKNKKKSDQKAISVRYYVSDQTNKFYYSTSGNKKIFEALGNGENSVILNNQDLNITHSSHTFHKKGMVLQHNQSTNTFQASIVSSRVMFNLKGKMYEMPTSQALKVNQCINLNIETIDLSLGVYEIKFDTMEQVNLFSGYVRKLQKQDNVIIVDKIVENMQVSYDVKTGEIVYLYSSDSTTPDALQHTIIEVSTFLKDNIKKRDFSIKHIPNITVEDIEKLKQEIQEDQTTECIYHEKEQMLQVKCMDQSDLMKTDWRIKILESTCLNSQGKEPVKYPDCWEPQKNDIEEFLVADSTPEFDRVQNLFKAGKIISLIRVQNKITYKKYYQEGLFLKTLNNGTNVKKMELFHGTRNTNPQQIYKDKEESFNINYSSDSNLLGRGIYFAQKSQYSNDYRHTESAAASSFFGLLKNKTNLYSQFLCEVYTGQSQKCPGHSGAIKDTAYRDPVNKIRFESMTDYLNNSNVYVVYKSRRAYPLYLIKY